MSCILNSDLLSCLKLLPDNSFDGVFCDPPYELGFMGKSWDSTGIAFQPETWAEVLRVCKPGAHLLAFGGSRTFHRLVCAVEDAGWEVRDVLMWVYGSGFPKSLDVSKAIDKAGAEHIAWFGPWFRKWRVDKGITQKQVAALFPSKNGGLTGCVANWELGLNMPTPEQFTRIRDAFGLPFESIEVAQREVVGCQRGSLLAVAPGQDNDRSYVMLDITTPATDAARQWDGWGTALKPAYEPVVLARKPLDGTVAQNVLQWGCGALWIDGGRIEGVVPQVTQGGQRSSGGIMNATGGERGTVSQPHELGRWPANALHDGLPEEWSRYFYCSKASTRERNSGCEGRNVHPTVKPLDLCQYLATLIMPPVDRPQGPRRLLVPFSGSGSEMVGAILAGWDDVTGIEREAEYVEIAKARLSHHSGKPPVVLLPEWLDL